MLLQARVSSEILHQGCFMDCLLDLTNEPTSGWILFSTWKVFELLLTFCSVTGLRSLVCRALFTPASSKPKDPNVNSAYDVVLYWASQSVETHSTVSLKALDFIKEIYEVRIVEISNFMSQIEVIVYTYIYCSCEVITFLFTGHWFEFKQSRLCAWTW